MAKKQKINYGPNLGLIGGARTLAESESMMTSAGGMAFGAAFSEAIMSGIEEREKSKAQIDAYASEIKLPSNIVKVDASNRPQIMEFIRQTRSNVVELAKKYERTKDQNILDEIQMEKAKVFNLNDQLGGFVADQQQYITASDKQLLARGKSFDYKKYDNIYSKNSTFSIDNDGSIGFTTNGVYEKWSDIGGRWNVNNNIWGTTLLRLDQAVVTNASKGGKFDKTGIYDNSLMLFNNMGAEEVQVALEQDVTGDAYENLSFENIWANGKMDPSYYKGYEAFKNLDGTYQTDWMFDDNNVRQASNLMARYTTDVLQNRHNDNFVNPRDIKNQAQGKLNLGKSRLSNETIYMQPQFVNNKIKEFQNAKKGDFIPGFEGANTYGFEFDGKDFIYKQYNPETREFEGDKKYNINDAITQFVPSHYLGGGSATSGGKLLD